MKDSNREEGDMPFVYSRAIVRVTVKLLTGIKIATASSRVIAGSAIEFVCILSFLSLMFF
jgi:hypothetical protein